MAVQSLQTGTAIYRDLAMIKVRMVEDKRLQVVKVAELFRAHILDVQLPVLIFEITGDDEKVTACIHAISSYGSILEVIRTGVIGLESGEHMMYESVGETYYSKNAI
jgi:acetolactate synthase I/III small subunit